MKHDIAFFDFLRGWAALVVFFHHAAILGGGPGVLASEIGQEAVNAFMLASGFLIFFQSSISRSYEGLATRRGISNFYIRRYFRIAPAYYVALTIALLLAPYLGEAREAIAATLTGASTDMGRYYIEDRVGSWLVHASFLFGMSPDYAFSTPLPDWSLGLEMQFYLLFPLLFFFYKRAFLPFLVVSLVGMFAVWALLKFTGVSFPMPSFLPLRFHNFAAGIVVAYLLLHRDIRPRTEYLLVLITLGALILGNRSSYLPALFLFAWWWVCKTGARYPGRLAGIQAVFRHRSSKFLSELSYSVYIIHLVMMLPFFAYVLRDGRVAGSEWWLATLVLLGAVMMVAYLIYRTVELPGIRLGKWLIQRRGSAGLLVTTPP